jgi:hypothetical protein
LLSACRRRAFDEPRRKTEAGSRPFGRAFHARFFMARGPRALLDGIVGRLPELIDEAEADPAASFEDARH